MSISRTRSANGSDRTRAGLQEEELAELRQAFALFDADNSGSVSATELKAALQDLTPDARQTTVTQIIKEIDKEGRGLISFDQFVSMMTAKLSDRDTRDDCAKVFRLFDVDGHGSISQRDLRRIADELGEAITGALLGKVAKLHCCHTAR